MFSPELYSSEIINFTCCFSVGKIGVLLEHCNVGVF